MNFLSSLFIFITAIFHCLFFKLESIDFMKDKTLKRFGLTNPQGEIVKLWAFNQGFYNLFLAFGLFYSLYLMYFKNLEMGKVLASYLLLFIAAAGVVLYFSSPKKYMAALIQSLPALLSLACLFFI